MDYPLIRMPPTVGVWRKKLPDAESALAPMVFRGLVQITRQALFGFFAKKISG
jgi:hypothetical protein